MPRGQEFLSAPNRRRAKWGQNWVFLLDAAARPHSTLPSALFQGCAKMAESSEQTHSIFENKHVWGHTSLRRNQRNCSWNTKSWETRGLSLWLVLCCWNPITFSCFFSSYVFLFNFLQPLTVSGVGKTFPPFPLLSLFLPIPSFLLLPPLPRICCSFPFELPYGCPSKIALL